MFFHAFYPGRRIRHKFSWSDDIIIIMSTKKRRGETLILNKVSVSQTSQLEAVFLYSSLVLLKLLTFELEYYPSFDRLVPAPSSSYKEVKQIGCSRLFLPVMIKIRLMKYMNVVVTYYFSSVGKATQPS